MAFVTTETSVTKLSGFTPPVMLVAGTYASSGGDTGGVIAAGYTTADAVLTAIPGAGSIGGRKILADWYTPTTNDATAPGAAISYNTSVDRQIATLVTTANSTGRYYLFCLDNGA